MVRNKDARRYLREVRALLPGAGKQKRDILNRIEAMVAEYLTENPDADYAGITSRLGAPNQIAASCLEEMDANDLVKKLHIKKRIICIAAAAALAIVMLWVGVILSAWQNYHVNIDGQFSEEIINVSDEQDE